MLAKTFFLIKNNLKALNYEGFFRIFIVDRKLLLPTVYNKTYWSIKFRKVVAPLFFGPFLFYELSKNI